MHGTGQPCFPHFLIVEDANISPSLAPRWYSSMGSGSSPISTTIFQNAIAHHRHPSGCLAPPTENSSSRAPNKFNPPTPPKTKVVISIVTPPCRPSIAESFQDAPPPNDFTAPVPGQGQPRRKTPGGRSVACRDQGHHHPPEQLATPNCPRFNSTSNRRVSLPSRLLCLVLLTARIRNCLAGPVLGLVD